MNPISGKDSCVPLIYGRISHSDVGHAYGKKKFYQGGISRGNRPGRGLARPSGRQKNLLVFSPGYREGSVLTLSGHAMGTKDCLTMGPKIITCGADSDGTPSLRIWGSEFFVRTELSKLFIKP